MAKNDQHVVPHDKEWAVRRPNTERVGSVHPTKQDAIDTAVDRAKKAHSEVFIHRKDGVFPDRDSYGHDPKRSKDRVH